MHDAIIGLGECKVKESAAKSVFMSTEVEEWCTRYQEGIHNHFGFESPDYVELWVEAFRARRKLFGDCSEQALINEMTEDIRKEIDKEILERVLKNFHTKLKPKNGKRKRK